MIENFDNKYLQSFEYETTAISDGNIIGTCELGRATIQMINDSNEYSSLKGQWIKTIHGSFYIHSVEPVQEKVNIKLSCYDVKYKLDTQYDSSLYTWPMTLKKWRNAIFINCGVSYDDTDFPNSNLELTEEPYIGDNSSNRNVISLIAQAGCSWVDTDSDDVFYFKWFEEKTYTVKDWLELTTEKEHSSKINTVVLGRGDVEDNVYYPEELPDNPVEFRIDNNYILDPQETDNDIRYGTRIPIYERVNGFSYLVFNMRTQDIENRLSIKLGEKVSYIDLWGNTLEAYIMTKKIVWLGGNASNAENYELTLSAEKIKETATEYSYAASVENRLLTVERTTNKNDGIITDLVKSVKTLDVAVGNNYQEITKKFDDYVPESDFVTLESSVKQLQTDTYTKTEINTKLTDGSVTKVMTTSGTFDENGMHYEKTNAPTSSTINEKGVEVDSTTTGEELLFAGYDEDIKQTIVRTENLTVRKYLVVGDNSRIENYGNGGGVFIL